MLQAFIVMLREGFESFLIVAIILAYLRKTDRRWLLPAVYLALAFSLLSSGGLGLLLVRGVNQSLWEGVLGIVTIVMVGTLVVHMWRTAPRLKQTIQSQLQTASSRGSRRLAFLGVFLFSAMMITREGMETALMLLQVRDRGVLSGIFLGLLAAAGVSWLWVRFSHLVNLKRFFQVTGIYLILFMVQIAIYSFHEFLESGLIPNSEALHAATEPFSPVGIYGQWFSPFMIGACGVWLVAAWCRDRVRKMVVLAGLAGLVFAGGEVKADSRHFTYSYEADSVLPKGRWEFEQWITSRSGRESGVFHAFDFREELEYGLIDRLTSALYLNFRNIHREGAVGEADLDGMEFKGISSEWKYMVLSPHLDPLGLLLYGEARYEGEELELEGKVILQRNLGDRWIWVFNAAAAPEWEFKPGGTEKGLELEFTSGLAYKLSPHWSTGLEVRNHQDFADFSDHEHGALFVGPNLAFEASRGWATVTVLPQIPGTSGNRVLDRHEKIEVRLIAGLLF